MPTKDGVFYDMEHSPYKTMYGDYTFHFSSRKHLSSFLDKLTVRIEWLNDSLAKRFKFNIDARLIALFQLYFQVETRGCYVVLPKGRTLTCRENLVLNGLQASASASTQPQGGTTTPSEKQLEIIQETLNFYPS